MRPPAGGRLHQIGTARLAGLADGFVAIGATLIRIKARRLQTDNLVLFEEDRHEHDDSNRLGARPEGLDRLIPDLEALYKDVHAHPELSMQEVRTAGLAADRLRKAGFERRRESERPAWSVCSATAMVRR